MNIKRPAQSPWGFLALLCVCVPVACDRDAGTAELPQDTQSHATDEDTGPGWFPTDTGPADTLGNEDPEHTLDLLQGGEWSLSPVGSGPYDTLTGTLTVTELLDGGAETPWCSAEFALTGAAIEAVCDGCEFGMAVSYYLVSDGILDSDGEPVVDDAGDRLATLEHCQTPDLPTDGAILRFALHDTDEHLYLDYGDSGIWLPWYGTERVRQSVDFSWSATVGFRPDEDDR